MKRNLFFLCLFFLFILFICCTHSRKKGKNTEADTSIGYNLSVPDGVSVLPGVLQEISGITEVDSSILACVQDERETVFFYDLNKNRIVSKIKCGYKGDYEGIARADKTLYILRSDGMITEIRNFESEEFIRSSFATGIPWKDNEGICYDQKNNRLLITPKETPGKESGNKNKRYIFGYSLTSKKLEQEPVFTIDLSVIDSFALENNSNVHMKYKKKDKKKEPAIKFLISDMAIHPITGKLYLVSSADRLLFVFTMKNEIEFIGKLSPDLFQQPEGITFMKNGDMYISNEGREKSPTLVWFKYRPLTVAPNNN